MTISMLDKAITLAVACHGNHLDKAGYPEILHPLGVMGRLRYESEEIKAAAVLHDTVEDGYTTIEHILDNFPVKVAELVSVLTRNKGKEQYFDYIKRIAANPDAIKIKKADIADNMTRRSPAELKDIHKKYLKALHILNGSVKDEQTSITFKLPDGAYEAAITYTAEYDLLYIKFASQKAHERVFTRTDVLGRVGLHVDLHDDETCHGIEII